MKLDELERLKKYNNEGDLLKISEEIGDKIIFRGYDQEQILFLVNELVRINLLSVNYETREQILYVLCDAISYYDIRSEVKWNNIISIKDKLEDDLKEYVEELVANVSLIRDKKC